MKMTEATPVTPQNDQQELVLEPDEQFKTLQDHINEIEYDKKRLSKLTHLNPSVILNILLNDLYPLLAGILKSSEYYVMDLNSRLQTVEETVGVEEATEALSPEFAEELNSFIIKSLQVFGKATEWANEKKDSNFLYVLQELIVQAPVLISHIQDIASEEEEEDEELEEAPVEELEEDDETIPEVLEPKPQPEPQPQPQVEETKPSEPEEKLASDQPVTEQTIPESTTVESPKPVAEE
jgi:hypothetical protein